ncbi:MAG TPA: tetratricopeptide repeat protein [Methylocella sp.]
MMSGAVEPPRDIASHPAEANHTQLHCQSFFTLACVPSRIYPNAMNRHWRCAGGAQRGFEMDEIFKGLFDKAPDIISKAAQNPLGLASLIVLVLGILGAFLFRNAAGNLKLLAFAMITAGLLGLFLFASNSTKIDNPGPKPISPEQVEQIRNQAATKLAEAERQNFSGQLDRSRAAFDQAGALYEQIGDRIGQAKVRFGLGGLERTLSRDDQARADFDQAIALYKQEDNRIGQAKVLSVLGDVESRLGRKVQARADFDQAIALFKQGKTTSMDRPMCSAPSAPWRAGSAAMIRLARPTTRPWPSTSRQMTVSDRAICLGGSAIWTASSAATIRPVRTMKAP